MDLKEFSKRVESMLTHTTSIGKMWYFTSFVFRMIVAAVVGGTVYGGTSLTCVTTLPGCKEMCYNAFAPISPWTFWKVQLCGVALPMIGFQFVATYFENRYKKGKLAVRGDAETLERQIVIQNPITSETANVDDVGGGDQQAEETNEQQQATEDVPKPSKRKYKEVVQDGNTTKFIFHDSRVKIAYASAAILRTIVEILFCVLLHILYTYEDRQCDFNPDNPYCHFYTPLKIPQQYLCKGPIVEAACKQQLVNDESVIACYIPRYWEKSIFNAYMIIVTYICVILSTVDTAWYIYKSCGGRQKEE